MFEMKKIVRIIPSLIMLAAIPPVWASATEFKAIEPKLIGAMHKVSHEKLDDALEDIQGLLKETPKFHLAQLVYADLLMAKAGLPGQLTISSEPLADDRINDLRHEAAELDFLVLEVRLAVCVYQLKAAIKKKVNDESTTTKANP